METPLQQISALIPLIEKIASDKAEQIITERMNSAQYSPPKTPDHHHNGVDSVQLGAEALDTYSTLSAQGDGTAANAGVVNPGLLGNQSVGQGPILVGYGNLSLSSQPNKATFVTSPIPVIYGNGVGVDSQFNGGNAPQGTVVFFDNGTTISGLWIKMADGTWRGSAASTFNIVA